MEGSSWQLNCLLINLTCTLPTANISMDVNVQPCILPACFDGTDSLLCSPCMHHPVTTFYFTAIALLARHVCTMHIGQNPSMPDLLFPMQPSSLKQATFAAGCFWGLELAFQRVPGVVSTSVGYSNGDYADPTYDAVCSGTTGHAEAVQVSPRCAADSADAMLLSMLSGHGIV